MTLFFARDFWRNVVASYSSITAAVCPITMFEASADDFSGYRDQTKDTSRRWKALYCLMSKPQISTSRNPTSFLDDWPENAIDIDAQCGFMKCGVATKVVQGELSTRLGCPGSSLQRTSTTYPLQRGGSPKHSRLLFGSATSMPAV